jgi:hypothetical protein
MATHDELFGSQGPRRPSQPKWDEVGAVHVGVITAEPTVEQERDNETKTLKWWPKEGGAPVSLPASQGKEQGLNPVTQIVVPVQLASGDEATFYFNGYKKQALQQAMQETELPLDVGTTVGVKFVGKTGRRKNWAIKLAKAE